MAKYFLSGGPNETLVGPFNEKELTALQREVASTGGRIRLVRIILVNKRIELEDGGYATFHEGVIEPSSGSLLRGS